jgi:hypothetical protein
MVIVSRMSGQMEFPPYFTYPKLMLNWATVVLGTAKIQWRRRCKHHQTPCLVEVGVTYSCFNFSHRKSCIGLKFINSPFAHCPLGCLVLKLQDQPGIVKSKYIRMTRSYSVPWLFWGQIVVVVVVGKFIPGRFH